MLGGPPRGLPLTNGTKYKPKSGYNPRDFEDQQDLLSRLMEDSSEYWDNGYQVTSDDATHFADALEKALEASDVGDLIIHGHENDPTEMRVCTEAQHPGYDDLLQRGDVQTL